MYRSRARTFVIKYFDFDSDKKTTQDKNKRNGTIHFISNEKITDTKYTSMNAHDFI